MRQSCFVIAKNPKEKSRLPFIVSLPVSGEKPVVLACGAEWPSAKDVFCLELDSWPEDPEVIDEVPVQACWRSGKAVHLVLKRRSRRRAMFVWTESKGRTYIFWRTQNTIHQARPGLKVPQARGLENHLAVAVDIRERYPWTFKGQKVTLTKRELPVGDYGVFLGDKLCAAVERKRISDLVTSAVSGELTFNLAELSRLPYAILIVEGKFSHVFKETHVNTGWLMNVLAALQITCPQVPWFFAETRDLAEGYAYRWLAAAKKAATTGKESLKEFLPKQSNLSEGMLISVNDRTTRLEEAIKKSKEEGIVWTAPSYARHFGINYNTARSDLINLVETEALLHTSKGDRHYYAFRIEDIQ
jgi:ERCC4-type nuclease